jgi:hypothetical protein
MRLNHGRITLMLSATALASASAMTGRTSGGFRNYMDFPRRGPEDRRAYWGWRHG